MENKKSAAANASGGDTVTNIATEAEGLTRLQKLAALLLIITEENATQILRSLDELELEAVSSEMAKFTSISYDLQQQILSEFAEVAVAASTAVPGGVSRVERLLEKSVGLFRTSNILARVSPTRAPVAGMQQIVDLEPRHIFSCVRQERVQTIALVASYLTREKAGQLLALFSPDLREKIIERLATLGPTSVEVVESVAEELQRRLAGNTQRASNQTGGIKVAAQILNALPKNMSKSILGSLHERNSDLAQAVDKNMFTFEDLERLDTRTLQTILQAVDMHSLAVGLKTASEKLKSTLLGSISRRAAESIREEISFMGPLKVSEIDAAQSSIIDVVRQLEADGQIDLEAIPAQPRF